MSSTFSSSISRAQNNYENSTQNNDVKFSSQVPELYQSYKTEDKKEGRQRFGQTCWPGHTIKRTNDRHSFGWEEG